MVKSLCAVFYFLILILLKIEQNDKRIAMQQAMPQRTKAGIIKNKTRA